MAHSAEWEDYEWIRERRPELFVSTDQYEYVLDEDEVQKWEEEVCKIAFYRIGVKDGGYTVLDLLRLSDGTLVPHWRVLPHWTDKKEDYSLVIVIPKVDDKYILFQYFRPDESLKMYTYISSCSTEEFGDSKPISCEKAVKRFIQKNFSTEVISTVCIGIIGRYKVYVANILPPKMTFLYESRFYKKDIPDFIYMSKEELRKMLVNGTNYEYKDTYERDVAALLMCLLHDENS